MSDLKKRKKRKKRGRKAIDPDKLAQLRQKRAVRAVFARLGFSRCDASFEFTFNGRTGDIDDLFLAENILVACEYTIGKKTSEHVLKKKAYYEKLLASPAQWLDEFAPQCPD